MKLSGSELAHIVNVEVEHTVPGNDWETGKHDVAPTGARPNIVPKGRTYYTKITNIRNNVSVVLKFQVGSGLTYDDKGREQHPTIEDVFMSLWSDAHLGQYTFQEWAEMLGYDTDSIADRKVYFECQEATNRLNKLMFNADETEQIARYADNY